MDDPVENYIDVTTSPSGAFYCSHPYVVLRDSYAGMEKAPQINWVDRRGGRILERDTSSKVRASATFSNLGVPRRN